MSAHQLVSQEERVLEELLARRRARNSLLSFAEYTHPSWKTGEHHRRICDALERIERREIDRLMIFAPPRHSKSELASRRFPAWYLGRHPDHQVINAAYGGDLATDVGADVRDIIKDPYYQRIFPETEIRADASAAGRWRTNKGGVFFAAGVGGPVVGRGGHLIIIDDPVKGREEAESERIRQITWQWYFGNLITRLMPGGAIVLMMCMTGDTPVLMADGTERPLGLLRPGQRVATWDGGLSATMIQKHRSSGYDDVFRITTSSGRSVRANARHPFLVSDDAGLRWVRVADLRPGQMAACAKAIGAERRALPLDARALSPAKGIVDLTTTSAGGRTAFGLRQTIRSRDATLASSTATESPQPSMMRWLKDSMASALCADNPLETTFALIGGASCALTTATSQAWFAGSCATTAISPLVTPRQSEPRLPSLSTSDFTTEMIESIEPVGRAQVFDVQIEGTENFIANGMVSHNTRWHEQDLAGGILNAEGDQWEVLTLPAIEDEGSEEEKPLWPEQYPIEVLRRMRSSMVSGARKREWDAQYQQRPTAETGIYCKLEWFNDHRAENPPQHLRYFMASDHAVTEAKQTTGRGPDYTEHGVLGVNPEGHIYPVDWWSGRTAADKWIDVWIDLIEKWKPEVCFAEAGVIRRALEGVMKKRMEERGIYAVVEWVPSIADKTSRGRAFQARAAMGTWHFPRTEWAERVIDQCVAFPGGAFDDAFDVCSLFSRMVDEAHPAIVPKGKKRGRKDRWAAAFSGLSKSSWKTA